jgi:hypothetical protein
MLKTRTTKLTALFASVLSVLAVGAAVALGASEDSWKAGANKAWSASSPKTTFVSTAATITCTTNTASGPSVGSGPDIGALTMNAPKFSNCKDSLGDPATVTTKASGWTVSFISDIGNTKCPVGTGKDEISGADCVVVGVPKNAATIVLGGVKACTITVQPNGPTKVGAKATDPGGTTKDKIAVSSQPLSYKGCGVLSGTAKFSGTYTLKSPNSGVLVDRS